MRGGEAREAREAQGRGTRGGVTGCVQRAQARCRGRRRGCSGRGGRLHSTLQQEHALPRRADFLPPHAVQHAAALHHRRAAPPAPGPLQQVVPRLAAQQRARGAHRARARRAVGEALEELRQRARHDAPPARRGRKERVRRQGRQGLEVPTRWPPRAALCGLLVAWPASSWHGPPPPTRRATRRCARSAACGSCPHLPGRSTRRCRTRLAAPCRRRRASARRRPPAGTAARTPRRPPAWGRVGRCRATPATGESCVGVLGNPSKRGGIVGQGLGWLTQPPGARRVRMSWPSRPRSLQGAGARRPGHAPHLQTLLVARDLAWCYGG